MGMELARVAALRGARVTLVLGPTSLEPPAMVETVRVTSARQMHQEVMVRATQAAVVIKAAAVSDYCPAQCAPQKVKKRTLAKKSAA